MIGQKGKGSKTPFPFLGSIFDKQIAMGRKNLYCLIALLLLPFWVCGQIVTTDPSFPTASGEIKIIFDASLSSGGLATYTGSDVYAHTGVITDKSASDSDWKYAPTWLNNAEKYKLTSLGSKKWQLTISPDLHAYYGVPASEKILKMAFVFRNSTGSVEGKNSGKDIFVTVYSSALNVVFSTPATDQFISRGSSLTFTASSSIATNIRLLMNGVQVKAVSQSTSINHSQTFSQEGAYQMVVEAGVAPTIVRDTVNVFVQKDPVVAARPVGTRAGINMIDNATVTLALYAPGKSSVFVLGDFNDWTLSNDYILNKDGDYWWITLSGLTPGKEYAFQYLVDGSIRIAEPYADKILDPWNDSYIPSSVYPDLKTYPTGKTTGIVSVLQTAQTPFSWASTNYSPPAIDKLVIYELLVRDFTTAHSFDAAKEKLDYLQSLGVNAIELMPVNEFEGNNSWGYNPSFYFAVDKYYGTKNAFKALIDECHKRGIAVIMDMVLNHSYGQSPFVQLYWDSANSRPAANNPWYNVSSPNTAYSWGYDFNHESPQTRALVDSINSYWMNEYKVDGFRFDFTKGFTNTPGDGSAYDASRITILERMANQIWKRNPNAYVIFEHLADNSEEKVLSDAGIMLWGNMNYNYCEAIMSWTDHSDLSWGIYTNRGWNQPNLLAYMESHDEERMMYKALAYGNASGNYSVKDLSTALDRAKLCASFYLLQPGSKMIWQFGELGYDYSINTASDGVTIGESYRTAEKPVRWDYYDVVPRKALHDVYTRLIGLKKNYPVFSSTDVSYSIGATLGRSIIWRSAAMNAFLVGNFGVSNADVSLTLPKAGTWFNAFSGEAETFSTTSFSKNLAPGEYRLYIDNHDAASVDMPLASGELPLVVTDKEILYKGNNRASIYIYDLSGRNVCATTISRSLNIEDLKKGVYLVQLQDGGNNFLLKMMKK
jgi:glycosidase